MHTPGPWHLDLSKSFYVFAHGSLAEQAGVQHGPFICNASNLTDARLIAAAPDLLDALYTALPFVEDAETDTTYKRLAVRKVIRTIKDAIAKATQEQT